MGVPGNADLLLLRSAAAEGGYTISRSLRFNASDSAYLSRTPASAGNRKTWTWAGWVKRSAFPTGGYNAGAQELFTAYSASNDAGSTEILFLDNQLTVNGWSGTWRKTTAVYRDPSAWYHIVVALDTTQATASNRLKIYVNGSQVTDFATSTDPSQNADLGINNASAHAIGRWSYTTPLGYFDGLLADVFFIDGQALDPSSFVAVSATTGQLIPKQYTGSFGTNGFWLKFSDNSAATATTLGKDYSGNNNNWSPSNLSVTAGAGNDSLVDTPTSSGTDTGVGGEVRGNYATLNPLNNGGLTLANGNLDYSHTTSAWDVCTGTIAVNSGKWYWEVTVATWDGSGAPFLIGIANTSQDVNAELGQSANSWCYLPTGQKRYNGSTTSYGAALGTGNVVGIALDMDAGTLTFYKNGTSQGQAFSSISGYILPAVGVFGNTSQSGTYSCNFGQRPFAYTAPSGFKALCDTNLPAPVVAKSSTVMDVKLYTGNGGTQTISGLSFSPDLVWIKNRTSAYNHGLWDTVRGATNALYSSLTNAEGTESGVSAFNSDGFSVGSSLGYNKSSDALVAWCFDAGSNTVSNTQGSITSTVSVRANPSAGFSVVGYSGASGGGSWGHGLGVEPIFIIFKRRNAGQNWFVFHKTSGSWRVFEGLNNTNADSNYSGSMSASSTVVSLPSIAEFTTDPSSNYIAYCWAPVTGYNSISSYVGNGSSDGVFVYTGHRTRWLMIKRTDASDSWQIMDAARSDYNVADDQLYADLSNAEGSTGSRAIDFLSNGFKVRGDNSGINANGGTYVYVSFAESPFQYARAR